MPIVAIDLFPLSANHWNITGNSRSPKCSEQDYSASVPRAFPQWFHRWPGSTRAFFNSCNLGQVVGGRDYPMDSLKQLVAEVPFFDVDWNFLPVESCRISCCCESYDHTLKVLSAMQCTCLFMLLTPSYKWNLKLWTHATIMTRASITCWNWLTALLAMHGSPQIPIHWKIIPTLGRRSKAIEKNKQKILGTCSEIAFASWPATLQTWPSTALRCVNCLPSSWRSSSHLQEGKVELSYIILQKLRYLIFEISFKQRWPEIVIIWYMQILKIESLIKV